MQSVGEKIKLNNETIFFHHLSQDKEKLRIYREALRNGKIAFFDQSLLTRLRKMYFGFYSAVIYIFGFHTTFDNIGNKVELLSHALADKDFKIVHGKTDSTREIRFFLYGSEHLDFNSWLEVDEGGKTWVYDLFSLMKFDKDTYYALEHPDVSSIVSKKTVMDSNYDRDKFMTYSDGFNFILLRTIPQLERVLLKHPFKNILETEISRFKSRIDYEEIELEYKVFQKEKF